MIHAGKFDCDSTWLHFLGVGDLKSAVLLTTLKDCLNDMLDCKVEVSYDTSTPFRSTSRHRLANLIKFSPYDITFNYQDINLNEWANSTKRFNYSGSEIGQHLRLRDIIYNDIIHGPRYRELGKIMLTNHNIHSQMCAIDALHQILNITTDRSILEKYVPKYLLEAQDAIRDILSQPTRQKAGEKLFNGTLQKHLNCAYRNICELY